MMDDGEQEREQSDSSPAPRGDAGSSGQARAGRAVAEVIELGDSASC